MLDEIALAANAHDTDRYLALYLHQPSLVFIANGLEIHGWDDLRIQQLKWWNNGKSDVVYTQHGPTEFVVLAPDSVMTTQSLTSHRTLPNGQPGDGTFVITSLWKKLPEGWKVVYGHESWVR